MSEYQARGAGLNKELAEKNKVSMKLELMNHIQLESDLICKLDDLIDQYVGFLSVAQVLGVLEIQKDSLKRQQENRE